MAQISDFTDAQLWTLRTTLDERWGKDAVQYELADAEIRLHPGDRELTECPVAVFKKDNCSFVIMKTGDSRFRGQFFYRNYQQYGTAKKEFDNMGDCVVTLLQTHADKESENFSE